MPEPQIAVTPPAAPAIHGGEPDRSYILGLIREAIGPERDEVMQASTARGAAILATHPPVGGDLPIAQMGSTDPRAIEAMIQLNHNTSFAGVRRLYDNRGLTLAGIARCIARSFATKWQTAPREFALQDYGEGSAVGRTFAATNSTSWADGGALIEGPAIRDFIEYLRPSLAFMRLGPNVDTTDRGGVYLQAGLATGATATFSDENRAIPLTQPTTFDQEWAARKLTAMSIRSNEWLRRATPDRERMLRDDMVSSIAQRADLCMWRGDGTAASFKGLLHLANTGNVFAAQATPDLTKVTEDLRDLWLKLLAAYIPLRSPGWGFSPRTFMYLMTLRDTNGHYVFRDEMVGGTLWGIPFAWTQQIPDNLGGGTNESEVYLADFGHLTVAYDEQQIRIDASDTAAYEDGATVRATFSRDQTAIRMIMGLTLVPRYDKAIAILNTVTWGA